MDNKSLWVHCPICRGKTRTKVYEDTVLVNFPLFCPKCKREIRVNVAKLKMIMSESADNTKEPTSPYDTWK